MNKAKIFYRPIEGSAPLSATFIPGPKGDAVEATNQLGVGFFSHSLELLGVIFDDVQEEKDHQYLLFPNYRVEVWTRDGKVKISVKKRKNLARNHSGKAA